MSPHNRANDSVNYKRSFRVLTALFFMWGLITVMNDLLNNSVREIFQLDPVRRSLIQFTFFGAYFIISILYYLISSGIGYDPINRIGYGRGMKISLMICSAGCFGFYPASLFASYPAFLASLFVLATGVTLLQICSNLYASVMGPPETASSRLNLAQGFNSLGTTVAPVIGLILLYRIFSTGEPTVASISRSYLLFGSAFAALALVVHFAGLPAYRQEENTGQRGNALSHRPLRWGIAAIFFYVGCEVAVGNWLVDFLQATGPTVLKAEEAGYFLSYYWGGLMIGRVMAFSAFDPNLPENKKRLRMAVSSLAIFALICLITSIRYTAEGFVMYRPDFGKILPYGLLMILQFIGFITGRYQPARTLVIFSVVNVLLLVCGMIAPPALAFWAVIGTGLFFSIGWSNIFSLSIKGLGPRTGQGSALLVMAVAGGAILPMAQAWAYHSAGWGIRLSFLVPAIGLLVLIGFGLFGHQSDSLGRKS